MYEQADNEEDLEDLDALDQEKRLGDLIRRNPPIKTAEAPGGTWYQVPPGVEDPEVLETYDDGWVISVIKNSGKPHLVKWNTEDHIYYIPHRMVVIHATAMNKIKLIPDPFHIKDDDIPGILADLNVLKRAAIPDVEGIYHPPYWAKDVILAPSGKFMRLEQALDTGARRLVLAGNPRIHAWVVGPDLLGRADTVLWNMGIETTYARQNPDTWVFVWDENLDWRGRVLLAFRGGRQIGAAGKNMPKSDALRIAGLVAPALGFTAGGRGSMVKPGSNFHKMLGYVSAVPGSPRSGWWSDIGNSTNDMPSFNGSQEGLASRLGLITHRDPGRRETTYQMRITPRGQEVLRRLDAGETVDLSRLSS